MKMNTGMEELVCMLSMQPGEFLLMPVAPRDKDELGDAQICQERQ